MKPQLLGDNKTNCLPMELELAMGMPVMCTKNNLGQREVVDGTLWHVVGYQLPNNATSSHQVINESTGYTVTISSIPPNKAFAKMLGREEIIDPELPLGIVGIRPVLERVEANTTKLKFYSFN
jgi:hypothetical protein